MAGHTPGPWKFCVPSLGAFAIMATREDGKEVCIADVRTKFIRYTPLGYEEENPEEESRATGKLIAAAPDLLAACERILAKHDDAVFACGRDDEAPVAFALNELRKAIAKARG